MNVTIFLTFFNFYSWKWNLNFAQSKTNRVVELAPKMSRSSNFEYESLYYDLIGTKYEGKCPDLKIDGLWYEHEGFVTDNPKTAFRNMLNHGLKQSSRIIINRPNLTDAFMKRIIKQRVKDGHDIDEVWIMDDNSIIPLYKKSEEWYFTPPSGNESVVISYGIVIANDNTF